MFLTMMRCNMPVLDHAFLNDLIAYAHAWPSECKTVALFEHLLGDGEDPFRRERLAGHFTASAWVVSADGTRTLLTHHRKLGLWCVAALREAREESGLIGLTIEFGIFDLDRHVIPEHKSVPEHWHYDVRYVVRGGSNESYVVSDESHDLAWRDISVLANDPAADASVRRMAGKWLARQAAEA
jgi:8-oxo-dGTP pyrophosphatase MutT (NUDIX family)